MPSPLAKRLPTERVLHGETFVDDYAWMRDKDDPEVRSYLEAENAHTLEMTAHLAGLRERIFEEIRGRVQEDDRSAPARRGEWWYAQRTEEGRQYPIFVRAKGDPDGPEQVLLDVNDLAEGKDYMAIGVFSVSPDHAIAAYSSDDDGSETFTLRFRDLASGADLPDEITGTYYTGAWSADGRFFFYTTIDDAHRPYRVWRHRLGDAAEQDELVFEESDERFYLEVGHTQDRRYLLIDSRSQTTSETLALPAEHAEETFSPVIERVPGVEYSVDHHEGRWLVVTNEGAVDGKLMSVAVSDPLDAIEVIPGEEGRKLSGVLALARHVVLTGRAEGQSRITVLPPDGGTARDLVFAEEVHAVGLGRNLEYETATLRVAYQSPVTPPTDIDVDLVTGEQTVVKQTVVRGDYDPARYTTTRLWATAPDGTQVPLSVVHLASLDRSRPAPTLLYGYGSYESTIDPWFSYARLSLLERGIVFAIAHVRGGGEMGRRWYEQGKLAHKGNTFTDFIACAERLVADGYTEPGLLAARGASAGGLLMGAVANLRPDLFCAIVAEVPFVDAINTMLDETLPLTVIEWEEWGNPRLAEQYEWMRAYSPYDNIREDAEYPAILATAGLNDPRVAFWEPAKWVAKLRATARARGPVLLKTEMGAGHAGPSGRYDAWRDEAFVLAFLLDRWGMA